MSLITEALKRTQETHAESISVSAAVPPPTHDPAVPAPLTGRTPTAAKVAAAVLCGGVVLMLVSGYLNWRKSENEPVEQVRIVPKPNVPVAQHSPVVEKQNTQRADEQLVARVVEKLKTEAPAANATPPAPVPDPPK